MPLDVLLHHWSDFLFAGAPVAHEDPAQHTDVASAGLVAHGSTLPVSDLHADVHSSLLFRPSAASRSAVQHTAFLSAPFPRARARLREKVDLAHAAAHDFKRTRLYYKGRHLFHTHTAKYGLAEAFGIGALVGGVVLMRAPLPDPPAAPPKSAKEAAVDAFKAKRAQPAPGEMPRHQPKLPGDRLASAPGATSRRSLSSSGNRSGSNSRGKPVEVRTRRQRVKGQQLTLEESDAEPESDSDEASMSA